MTLQNESDPAENDQLMLFIHSLKLQPQLFSYIITKDHSTGCLITVNFGEMQHKQLMTDHAILIWTQLMQAEISHLPSDQPHSSLQSPDRAVFRRCN